MNNLDIKFKVLQYYHTSIRNIGLYTSLAFAALVYSRFHRGKSLLLNIGLIVTSLIFTIISIVIGYYLLSDLKYIEKENNSIAVLMDKWTIIPNALIHTNYFIIICTLFVFFMQFR